MTIEEEDNQSIRFVERVKCQWRGAVPLGWDCRSCKRRDERKVA